MTIFSTNLTATTRQLLDDFEDEPTKVEQPLSMPELRDYWRAEWGKRRTAIEVEAVER